MKSRYCSSRVCNHKRGDAPRYVCRRILPLRILILIVLVLVLVWSAPVSAVILEGQVLGRASGPDQGIEPTFEFTRDDVVVSGVTLNDSKDGDIVTWAFTGPQGMKYNESRTLTPGQGTARATLDLSLLSSGEAVGSWTLDISLNEEPADQVNFTVEPLTGLVWWGPFAGAIVMLVIVIVVAGVVVLAGIALKKRFSRGKT